LILTYVFPLTRVCGKLTQDVLRYSLVQITTHIKQYSMAVPSEARTLFGWGRGFKSRSRHGCVCLHFLVLCCPVYVEVLRRTDSPV